MLQCKKLQYYAKQNGIEDYHKVVLTDEDCKFICDSVGVKSVSSCSVEQRLDILISRIMDDPGFMAAHRSPDVSEDLFLIRCGDYAATEIFKAYADKHNLKHGSQSDGSS